MSSMDVDSYTRRVNRKGRKGLHQTLKGRERFPKRNTMRASRGMRAIPHPVRERIQDVPTKEIVGTISYLGPTHGQHISINRYKQRYDRKHLRKTARREAKEVRRLMNEAKESDEIDAMAAALIKELNDKEAQDKFLADMAKLSLQTPVQKKAVKKVKRRHAVEEMLAKIMAGLSVKT